MVKIAYCTPGLGRSGGVRVILEHCTRLKARGHDVTIINPSGNSPVLWEWYGPMDVPVVQNLQLQREGFDVCVATGGSTVYWAKRVQAKRYCYFIQMMEHLFFRPNTSGYQVHYQSYHLARSLGMQPITIAEWLRERLSSEFNMGTDPVVIPNGVNRGHFHPEGKKQNYVLVEGDDRNQAKDIEGISWAVAQHLRQKYDVAIYGYAALEHKYVDVMDEFFLRPSTAQIRRLYSGALFLLKASRLEGRACGPVEAMSCGTTTVRGIIHGDDDLIHGKNCLRVGYDLDAVTEQAEKLMEDNGLRARLEKGCRKYAKKSLNWDKIIDTLEVLYGIG